MSRDLPLISGCYIVKDEEEMLAASLAAVAPFVDEVIVYDTGSTDTTRELAQAHGARVIEGYWDDDFGAARNRALEHCTGEWVLMVDADEIVHGDARAWYRDVQLASCDAFSLQVASGAWGEVGQQSAFRATRAFRRSMCRFEGALHEQVVGRWGRFETARCTTLRLEHHGYSPMRIAERDKGARNVGIASKALEEARRRGVEDLNELYVDLGRSATGARDYRRALEVFAMIDRETVNRRLGVHAAHSAVLCAVKTGDAVTGRSWLSFLRAHGEGAQICRTLEGRLLIAEGDYQRAEAILASVTDDVDIDGIEVKGSVAKDDLIYCLLAQEKFAEALSVMLPHIASGGSSITAASAVWAANSCPGGLDALARAVPGTLEKHFIAQLSQEYSLLGEAFLEAMWRAGRTQVIILAAISRYGTDLPIEKALVWSLRLREAGHVGQCPFRQIFASPTRGPADRVLSGGILLEIGDEVPSSELDALVEAVPDEEATQLLATLQLMAPRFASRLSLEV